MSLRIGKEFLSENSSSASPQENLKTIEIHYNRIEWLLQSKNEAICPQIFGKSIVQ